MIHLITYDLETPNDTPDDYARVIAGLKSHYAKWCHLEKSVWLVVTDQNASDVRDSMKQFLNSSDVLFVAKLSGNWASFNLGARRVAWLKDKTF